MSFDVLTGGRISGMDKAEKFQFLFVFGILFWIASIALNFIKGYEFIITSRVFSIISIISSLTYFFIFIISEKK